MLKEYSSLLPYFKKYKWQYILGFFCLITIDIVQILVPQYLKRAIDSISDGYNRNVIIPILLSMVGMSALIGIGRFFWRYFLHGASRRIELSLRNKFFSKIMTLPMSWFGTNSAGDIMAKATSDMNNIRIASGMAFVTLIDGTFMSIAILTIMLIQNPITTLFTIIPLPLLTLLIIAFFKMIGKRFKKNLEKYSNMTTVVQETMQGIRVVKSFVKEDEFAKRFFNANQEYRSTSMDLVKIQGLFYPLISFLAGTTTLVLIVVGGKAVLANQMSPGNLTAMLSYLDLLIWPMLSAGHTVNMFQRGAASIKRVNQVLDTQKEKRYADDVAQYDIFPSNGISINHLSLKFPDSETPVLDDISFDLQRGKFLGILGKVGSGKTVLIKTLVRIYEPPHNSVLINGIDVGSYPLEKLRQFIGFVPQDSFLFSDSLKANVLFANPCVSEERFLQTLKISALDRDLDSFSNGWDTIVGEKGLTLSGGQKQRVAIARALVIDPNVLILDDAMSAVDAETEKVIISGLLEDRKGKTTIIISNRIAALSHCDTVAVLDKGKLVEFGSPEELTNSDGFYSEIAALQSAENIESDNFHNSPKGSK